MVHDRENLSSVLDSVPQISKNLAKRFKNVFNNCKNAGLCYRYEERLQVATSINWNFIIRVKVKNSFVTSVYFILRVIEE
jgi:hypothetical protein